MHLLENVFTNEHGEAITVLQLLTKFKMTLTEIDNYLNEYGNRLNSIEFLNATQQQELILLKFNVGNIQNSVNNIQLTLADYLLRFQNLDMQLTVINDKIDINISDIDTLKTYVNNLGIQIININNLLNLLRLTVQGHTTQITNLETSVSSINSDLVDIDSSISLINTQLSNLTVFITDFESRLSVLETKVNNIGIDIIAINNLFNIMNLTVQEHTTQITNLDVDILTINNKNDVQDTTLTSHDVRITLLENSGVGGGNLQLLVTKIVNYNLPQGSINLDTGSYIFERLSAGTDFSKVKIVEQVFGNSAGDADALSKTGVNFAYYIQNGVDIFSLSKLGAPAPQSMNFNVYYHIYKVL